MRVCTTADVLKTGLVMQWCPVQLPSGLWIFSSLRCIFSFPCSHRLNMENADLKSQLKERDARIAKLESVLEESRRAHLQITEIFLAPVRAETSQECGASSFASLSPCRSASRNERLARRAKPTRDRGAARPPTTSSAGTPAAFRFSSFTAASSGRSQGHPSLSPPRSRSSRSARGLRWRVSRFVSTFNHERLTHLQITEIFLAPVRAETSQEGVVVRKPVPL